MPKIRPGMPKPPKGFELVALILDEYDEKMKDALAESHAGKRTAELTWGVAAINKERTRKLWHMNKDGVISNEVLEYCAKVNFVDASLIQLWAIRGYENACCVACVQSKNHDFGGTCICRVPLKDRPEGLIRCLKCGCTGCALRPKRARSPSSRSDKQADGEAKAANTSAKPETTNDRDPAGTDGTQTAAT